MQAVMCGVLLLFLLMAILFGPLAYFSSLNPSMKTNEVGPITFSVGVQGFPPFYVGSQSEVRRTLTDSDVQNVLERFPGLKEFGGTSETRQHLAMFSFADVVWDVSPPSRIRLWELLGRVDSEIRLETRAIFTRPGPDDNRIVTASWPYRLNAVQKDALRTALNTSLSQSPVVNLTQLFPLFWRLCAYAAPAVFDTTTLVDCELRGHMTTPRADNFTQEYWSLSCRDALRPKTVSGPCLIVMNDPIPQTVGGFMDRMQVYGIVAFCERTFASSLKMHMSVRC